MTIITYTDEELGILGGGECRYAGLVRVSIPDDPAYMWTGVGDLLVNNSTFDPDGTVYMGAARLIDLPTFNRVVNGLAERLVYTLNNVTDDMRRLAYELAGDIRYAPLHLGLILFNDNWAQVGPVKWLRRGRIDMIETANDPDKTFDRLKTIQLSIGSFFTGRKVPGYGTLTDPCQKSYPGSSDDRFCERTQLLTNTQKPWGRF